MKRIGIDIGSTSTKAVPIYREEQVLGGFYTATAGQPIRAVQRLIRSINRTFSAEQLEILGVATTGSGRMIIKELFNADTAVNEITAHAWAAAFLHPRADTILEIGGQDSKLTLLRHGEVYYSTMSYVCAAGRGSFIEEQAKRLEVTLADFSDMAFGARAPFTSDPACTSAGAGIPTTATTPSTCPPSSTSSPTTSWERARSTSAALCTTSGTALSTPSRT